MIKDVFLFLAIFLSSILYCGYKMGEEIRKTQKNKRYRAILWSHIIGKASVPVPIIAGIIRTVGWSFEYSLDYGDVFIITCPLYFGAIFISRRIYRRIQRDHFGKLPSSFYNKK